MTSEKDNKIALTLFTELLERFEEAAYAYATRGLRLANDRPKIEERYHRLRQAVLVYVETKIKGGACTPPIVKRLEPAEHDFAPENEG